MLTAQTLVVCVSAEMQDSQEVGSLREAHGKNPGQYEFLRLAGS